MRPGIWINHASRLWECCAALDRPEWAERARRGLPVYPIDERFLDALGEGIPESAGVALGVDRLVMLAEPRGVLVAPAKEHAVGVIDGVGV